MHLNPRSLALGLALIGVVAACESSPSGPGPIEGLPRDLTTQETAVLQASNAFGFDLFGRLTTETPESNVFISPLSASMALGMTMNGADGGTFEAMRQTLHFGILTREEINRSYRDLIDLLLGLDPAVTSEIANAIWHRHGFDVRDEFVEDNRTFFDAEVAGLDFASPDALATINGWAADKTHDRIPKILDAIEPDWVWILMNAVYFKGLWTEPFDPDNTRDGPFHLLDGSTRTVPLMSNFDEKFPGVRTEGWSAIELPYGGGAFTMVVVVPEGDRTLASIVAEMDAAAWDRLTARLGEGKFHVVLPRFELEYEKELMEVLADMGMAIAFTPAADFSRLSDQHSWIDLFKQKTFVKVDEEGTEAAAVTVGVGTTSLPPTVFADRPFLFAIRERFSGAILFIGQLVDPEA